VFVRHWGGNVKSLIEDAKRCWVETVVAVIDDLLVRAEKLLLNTSGALIKRCGVNECGVNEQVLATKRA
jgi:hypothetical protein